jgi:DNA-binding XRE family transcriptional regulator
MRVGGSPELPPLPLPEWAAAVTRRREALALTKSDLARAANVGRATVYAVEVGLPYVTERTLERIGEALDALETAAERDAGGGRSG